MKITREFAPADRYLYLFKVLTTDKGWAQLDSHQDASYFGTWINPTTRKIFNYCEGDCTLTECDDDAELQAKLATIEVWNAENGTKRYSTGKAIAIDPGFSESLKAACVAVGIGGHLH